MPPAANCCFDTRPFLQIKGLGAPGGVNARFFEPARDDLLGEVEARSQRVGQLLPPLPEPRLDYPEEALIASRTDGPFARWVDCYMYDGRLDFGRRPESARGNSKHYLRCAVELDR